jgi:hypothetical protein
MLMHYLSCSCGPSAYPTKYVSGHVTPNLCFYIRLNLLVTYCVPVRPGHETSTHFFSCSGGPGADPIESEQGLVLV